MASDDEAESFETQAEVAGVEGQALESLFSLPRDHVA